jgi:hypothetical protein
MIPTNSPEITAEIERAAAANIRSGKWSAPTPLLDAMGRALQDGAAPGTNEGQSGGDRNRASPSDR